MFKENLKYFNIVFMFFLLSCAHLNKKFNKNSQNDVTSNINLPSWVSEDCLKKNNLYFFVGYGEGLNASSAVRNAMLASRQNALACLFGGTISSSISISEDNEIAKYKSNIDLNLDYAHINWGGYESVEENIFYLDNSRTKVYIQYKWPVNIVLKEKDRLDKLAKKIDETNAMKKEAEFKNNIINEQKVRLAQLQKQEQELSQIKNDAERAIVNLEKMKKDRLTKQTDIIKIINNLYCGVTIEKFIEIFRAPDKVDYEYSYYTNGSIYSIENVNFYWDQYLIKVNSQKSGVIIKEPFNYSIILKKAKENIIDFIYKDYGKTNKGYTICK